MPRLLTGIKSSYHRATNAQVASLAEATTCINAARQSEHFISGFEGSQVDWALSLMDTVFASSSPTNRVFAVFESNLKRLKIIGGECKDMGPRSDSRGNLYWIFKMRPAQWQHTQFLIISSSYDRGMVVVLPRHYLYRKSNDAEQYRIRGFRAYWILHALPAFPPEYAPFVVPLARLGEALEAIRRYARGEIPVCFNPYTNVEFVGMPRPKTAPAQVLMPQLETWTKALTPIRFLQRIFRCYSETFDIELCNIFPMFGDFKIKHRKDSMEAFVEIKSGHCDVIRGVDRYGNHQISSMQHTANHMIGVDHRWTFSWKAQWDFLLTFPSSDEEERNEEAFFIAKDALPAG
ncbi:MAG: hypothetical protein Q9186_003134 [Xanthomendoza sp. 1 TL-2023]